MVFFNPTHKIPTLFTQKSARHGQGIQQKSPASKLARLNKVQALSESPEDAPRPCQPFSISAPDFRTPDGKEPFSDINLESIGIPAESKSELYRFNSSSSWLNTSPMQEYMDQYDQATGMAVQHLTASVSDGVFAHLPQWHLIQPQDVIKGFNAIFDIVRAEFSLLEQNAVPTWDGLILPMEKLGHLLGTAVGRVHHLQKVNFSKEMQTAFDSVQPALVELSTMMGQSRTIFDGLVQLKASPNLSSKQQRVVEQALQGMHHQGVSLNGQDKERFLLIAQELAKATTLYSQHLMDEAKHARVKVQNPEQIRGIPAVILQQALDQAVADGEQANTNSGPWHFKLDGATAISIMKLCENSEFREVFSTRFADRGTAQEYDNQEIVNTILRLKQAKAKLLGFENAAQMSLDTKMAKSEEAVIDLLEKLKQAAKPFAEKELQALTAFAKSKDSSISDLQPWDLAFWREQYVQAHYDVDQEKVRDFLQIPKVMNSLFTMMKDVFGLDITKVDAAFHPKNQEIPTWHPDVEFYEIKEQGKTIAGFFMDPYSRPGEKSAGAWMNGLIDKSSLLALPLQSTSIPVALFVLNARPPENNKPGLVSLADVETLFHEFGHAMQHMLTREDIGDISGINGVEWDAVEVASQLNENWVYRPEFLKSVTCHIETGQPLDDTTIQKIIDSRHYFAGNDCLRQVALSLIDFTLHQHFGHETAGHKDVQLAALSSQMIENKIKKSVLTAPFVETSSMLPSFSHIFAGGYSAGYYSYKWAEVMAADGFAAFEEAGLDNPAALKEVAKRYRDTILAQGGSRPAGDIYRDFRGRDATPAALLRHQGLITELA